MSGRWRQSSLSGAIAPIEEERRRRLSDDTVELRGRPFIRMISVTRAHGFARISASGASSWGQFFCSSAHGFKGSPECRARRAMIQEGRYRDLRAVAHRRDHSSGAATIADRAFLGKGVEKVGRTGSKP